MSKEVGAGGRFDIFLDSKGPGGFPPQNNFRIAPYKLYENALFERGDNDFPVYTFFKYLLFALFSHSSTLNQVMISISYLFEL